MTTWRYGKSYRLDPYFPFGDLGQGFRAEVADPVWFLGRQWQLGEHQGEDAASPTRVSFVAHHVPIDSLDGDSATDPRITPPEAIVESEPFDWWTPARRIRIGLAAAPSLPEKAQLDNTLLLAGLPVPYDVCNGRGFDGLVLSRRRQELDLPSALFAEVPPEPVDMWDPAELVYSTTFTAGQAKLNLPRHDGGDIDWYSVSATGSPTLPAASPPPVTLLPSRLKYPGAPHPRWWQIEDHQVDIGGFPPDRCHLATLLLIDLVVSHSDDWFSFPLDTEVGSVVTLQNVSVTDSFDQVTTLSTPADWSLFRVHGLDPASLVVWPTVASPLTGPAQDDVVVGVDEDANLLWAVERRANGRELAFGNTGQEKDGTGPVQDPSSTNGQVRASTRTRYDYRPSTTLPRYWHPYVIGDVNGRRRFVQGRLADLEARPPVPMPEPVTPLLYDLKAPAQGPVHQIEPATVPTTGLRLERRWVLGRRTDGQPVLWMQRRRLPLLGPPISGLRFDAVEQQPAVTP